MAERTSKSESAPMDLGADGHPAEGSLFPTSDKRIFARTGEALAEFCQAFLKLGRDLRADLASAFDPATIWLSALGAKSLSRLRDMELPAKIVEIARSGATWSQITHLYLRLDRKAPRRRRSVVLLGVAAACPIGDFRS
jgi:hypothetical protein